MPFIPHTEDDVRKMLEAIKASSIETLFDEIPAHLRGNTLSSIPDGETEMQVTRLMRERARSDEADLCFIGAGAYEHHIPAAVWELASRGEFLTAYTPYQAEASQGTLQVIYEFQTSMANLTAMDVCNASVYDGASGLAEAVLMAVRANKHAKMRRVLVPTAVHPHYRAALKAIVSLQDIEVVEVEFNKQGGHVDLATLKPFEGEDYTAIVVPQPNFFGVLEEADALTNWAHANNILVIACVNPMALAIIAPP
ncbi:MAG: glycine dehydrogenase, partial [Moraxellaceae bacterium]|nr:glycine dehydrogenase [Moraxellaceae bacterium]